MKKIMVILSCVFSFCLIGSLTACNSADGGNTKFEECPIIGTWEGSQPEGTAVWYLTITYANDKVYEEENDYRDGKFEVERTYRQYGKIDTASDSTFYMYTVKDSGWHGTTNPDFFWVPFYGDRISYNIHMQGNDAFTLTGDEPYNGNYMQKKEVTYTFTRTERTLEEFMAA